MIKHLYDTFSHWYRGGSIYFYSDPHFADDEMKYIRKNYIGDDEQVRAINKKIGKKDTIVFLGDIGDVEFIKKIRGYKVLVMGNHDVGASKYKRDFVHLNYDLNMYTKDQAKQAAMELYPTYKLIECKEKLSLMNGNVWSITLDNNLFDEVYEGPVLIGEKLMLSHEPMNYPFALNIHGHDHSGWGFNDIYHWNVCAENIEYTPVCIKEIVNSGRLKEVVTIHRATIDRATEKSKMKVE